MPAPAPPTHPEAGGNEPSLVAAALWGDGSWRARWSPLLFFLFTLYAISGSGVLAESATPLVVLAVSWLAVAAGRIERPVRFEAGWLPLIALLAWSSASLLWTVSPSLAALGLGRWLLFSAVLFVVGLNRDRETLVAAAMWAGLAGLVVSGVALLLALSGFNGYGRLTDALPVHRNSLGTRLAICLVFATPLFSRRGRSGLVVVGLGLVGMTTSRGALLGLLVGSMVAWGTGGRPRLNRRIVLVGLAALVAAAGGIAAVRGARDVRFRLHLHRIEDPVAMLNGRDVIWKHGWEMLAEHPVRGVGLGAFARSYEQRHPAGVASARWTIGPRPSAHNLWIEQASGLGWPGLLLTVGLTLQVVARVPRLSPMGAALAALVGTTLLVGPAGYLGLHAVAVGLCTIREAPGEV